VEARAGLYSPVFGTGSDAHTVDNVGDQVTELSGKGVDLICTTFASLVLADKVENLYGDSSAGQTLVGNGLDNTIWAMVGADTLALVA
jgi:hypothetical protein